MATGEIIQEWVRIKEEAKKDPNPAEMVMQLLAGEPANDSASQWLEANEISLEELEFVWNEAVNGYLAGGVVVSRLMLYALASTAFQLGFNVANARLGAGLDV